MARTQNARQINFIAADDVADDLEKCDNKTKVINEALRVYFSTGPLRLDVFERLQKLEDFEQRFMAYFARKDNEAHSEFCDCSTCVSNRRSFASSRIVPLDPEPQTFEKVLSVIERAIVQAKRMHATVVFECFDYKFKITADTYAKAEYAEYMEQMDSKSGNNTTTTIANPTL